MRFFFHLWASEGFVLAGDAALIDNMQLRALHKLALAPRNSKVICAIAVRGDYPANVVPAIGFSPDKMLQGRLFSYGDAQCCRPGVNHEIPVNAPRCPCHSFHRAVSKVLDAKDTT